MKMSTTSLKLRFDGPQLKSHMMDVTVLGPSLFALGELCKGANRLLNGGNASVKVLIKADVKSNCVTLDLQVCQSAWEVAKALIHDPNIASAKEILEWIGILTPAFVVTNLVEFLRWKKNRKEESAAQQTIDGKNVIEIKVEGDNNKITVLQPVYKLSKDIQVVESLKALSAAVSDENGVDEVTFISGTSEHLKIDKTCAAELGEVRADSDEMKPQPFQAFITVYQPTLDAKSKKWKFKFNQQIETIDLSQTNIVAEAMKRGKVVIGDTYKVQLEMTQKKTRSGDYKADFKALKVLDFLPGAETTQNVMAFHK